MVTLPAVPGRATGIGSWPGVDVMAAARVTFDELGEPPYLPYLPELPGRGPGADMVGRAAGILVDLPVDLQPSGWRLVDRPGGDLARAHSWLRQDLDVLAEVADGYSGPLKVQVTGPWTLAASLFLPRLERAVVDAGACRDLVASLAEGLGRHIAQIRDLVPGADIVVQLDEPSLPAVIVGALPTASGFGRLRPVEEPVVVEGLRDVVTAADAAGAVRTAIHCCASDPPVAALVRAGAGALSLDLTRLGAQAWEVIAAAVEDGVHLWAGAVPARGGPPSPDAVVDAIWTPWRRIGLTPDLLAGVVVTPACGLSGSTPAAARATLNAAKSGARVLAERAEEG